MAFSSMTFLFGFLPAVLVCYFLLPTRCRRGRNMVLLLFSLAFYAWGGVRLLPALLASCVLNWAGALLAAPGKRHRKAAYGCTLALNVTMLGYFKYTGFLVTNLNALGADLTVPAIALPAGISFFTFQAIAYLTDVYRGTIPAERSLGRVTLFMAFFPQLLQGPILRYGEFAPALTDRRETVSDAADGAVRFCFGLGKKVLLADALGQIANGAFAAGGRLTVSLAWLGAVAYTLQLYFDFSGYTDMAIGLGRVFGFSLPENFDYPYVSKSASEFWRRWHRTLSFWFRDYVYIPLGGSRCSVPRQLLNLLAVWLLTGLWHGAAWTFILWGLFFAVFLTAEKLWYGEALAQTRFLKHLYVLLLIAVSFVIFDAASVSDAFRTIGSLFGLGGLPRSDVLARYYFDSYSGVFLVAIVGATPLPAKIVRQFSEDGPGKKIMSVVEPVVLLALLAIVTAYLVDGSFNPFLYFRF